MFPGIGTVVNMTTVLLGHRHRRAASGTGCASAPATSSPTGSAWSRC